MELELEPGLLRIRIKELELEEPGASVKLRKKNRNKY